jgi:muramoyltetrapeptide carboxypeptidase
MLTQLSLSGALETVGGIIFGQFTRCDPPDAVPPTFEVLDLVNQHTAKLGIPVIYGVPIGHIEQQWLLPIGGKVRLVARAGSSKVELLEAPCQSANVTVRGEAEFSSCFETANQSTNAMYDLVWVS